MTATSPYSANDYSAVSNFRPYELPVNDIFKAISAQNQFWDAGAARVKSYHDNALNLKLSLEPNKEIRRKFMEDAEKELVKLSSMDLSDPSVQRKGMSIYKPLFKDEGIIYDDLATRHFEKVRNDALTYRNKDNGKQYSDINFKYAMDGYEEFISATDRMAGKAAYEKRREYTPYYDYTEDFQKALKDCKPSSIETQSPYYGKSGSITGYMKEEYLKQLTASQARGCLEAGLSPNAARQLQIEGAVNYKGRPDILAGDTRTYLTGVASNMSDQLQELAAQKLKLDEDKSLTKEQLEQAKEQLDKEMKSVGDELLKTNLSIEKIIKGDYTDILNNFDVYAGSVFSYRKLYKKALASAYEERRSVYKGDPVQLNAIRFEQDKYLAQMDHAFDVTMENLRTENDMKLKMLDYQFGGGKGDGDVAGSGADVFRNPFTGEITLNENIFRRSDDALGRGDKPEIDEKIYEKLNTQVDKLKVLDQQNNLGLYNELIDRGNRDGNFAKTIMAGFNWTGTWDQFKASNSGNRFFKNGKPVGIEATSWFTAYSKLNPKDEVLFSWQRKNAEINTGLQVLNTKIELAEKQVAATIGKDYNTLIKDGLKGIDGLPELQVTAADMQEAIEGKYSKVKLIYGTSSVPSLGGSGAGFAESVIGYEVNGKRYVENPLDFGFNASKELKGLQKLYSSVSKVNDKVNSQLKSVRITVYNQLGFDKEPWFSTNQGEKHPIVKMIRSRFAIQGADGKMDERKDIKVLWQDFSGGIQISVPGVKKGDRDKFNGIGTEVEIEDGIVTIKGTNYNVIPQAINNPTLKNAAYQLATIGETRSFNLTGPRAKVEGATVTVPIFISGSQKMMDIDVYKGANGMPEYRAYIQGATDKRPIVTASDPYQLFEAIEAARIKVNQ